MNDTGDSVGERFSHIKLKTLCPYAESAVVAYGPSWDYSKGFRDNVASISQSLIAFCGYAKVKKYHGFVCEIGVENPREFESVRRGFGQFLRILNEVDPSKSNCMSGDLLSKEWQFEFGSMRLFANVFGSCYEPWHSKHSPVNAMFVFFQPEHAFDLCGINPTAVDQKDYIRERFSQAGRPYSGQMIDSRIEAFLYMFPLKPEDPPVEWWNP